MEVKFEQTQNLELKITKEQIFSIELLELNNIELEQMITKEILENVILDYDNEEENLSIENILKSQKQDREKNDYSIEEKDYSQLPLTYLEDFREILERDFLNYKLSKEEIEIGKYLIRNLKNNGYSSINNSEISKKFRVNENLIEKVREIIKKIDNRGYASRNLKECLLSQIDESDILYYVVDKHLENLGKNKLKEISKDMNVTIFDVENFYQRVKKLNPFPSSGQEAKEIIPYIYPEIFITEKNSKLEIDMIDSTENRLHFNDYYIKLFETTKDQELLNYLKKKYERALFFIDAINRRKSTIKKVVRSIVEIQKDFFLNNSSLKICNLKILQEKTGLSESTISRTIKGKYLQSKKGIFPLKYFLVSGILKSNISKDEIKNLIRGIIEKENPKKPYSDQKILNLLKNKNVDIKRRTIAKYREELGILPSNLRKRN